MQDDRDSRREADTYHDELTPTDEATPTSSGSRPPKEVDVAACVVRNLLRPELEEWSAVREERRKEREERREFLVTQKERDARQERLVDRITEQIDRILERDATDAQAHRAGHEALLLARSNEQRIEVLERKSRQSDGG